MDALSQEEINALLNEPGGDVDMESETLSDVEKDAIGEVGNISMGTAATEQYRVIKLRYEMTARFAIE